MTLKELRGSIRTILDDAVGDSSTRYWSDAELLDYINEGFEEIAKRTKCLKDSSVSIDMVADQRHYPYPDGVFEISSIRKSWDGRELGRTTHDDMRESDPLWKRLFLNRISS